EWLASLQGQNGTNGTNGQNGWSTLTQPFIMPGLTLGANTGISPMYVAHTGWASAGLGIHLPGGAHLIVVSIDPSTPGLIHVKQPNAVTVGYTASYNPAAGTVFAVGTQVQARGRDGISGSGGGGGEPQ